VRPSPRKAKSFDIGRGSTRRQTCWVYVIQLPDAVAERRNRRREIVYVGMTCRSVEHRFEQHKNGEKSARIIKKACRLGLGNRLRLRPDLMELAGNPQGSQHDALEQERALAKLLERRGYTVFSN